DAVGPAAEDHHLALVRRAHFVVAPVISGIVIGRVSLELRGASVDEPVAGDQTELPPFGADLFLRAAGQMSDLSVGETECFGFGQLFRVHSLGTQKKTGKGNPMAVRVSRVKKAPDAHVILFNHEWTRMKRIKPAEF